MAAKFDPSQTGKQYDKHSPRWQMELDFSEFTLDVAESGDYLPEFSDKEHPDDYAHRKSMSCPLDMCRDGVRIRVDNLWRTAPKRTVEGKHKAIIEQLISDADGDGTTLDTFMRQAARGMYATGVDIVTQVTAADRNVKTLADEQAAGIRPYFMRFDPLARLDWSAKGSGTFKWARYALGYEPSDDERGGGPAKQRFLTLAGDQWRVWAITKTDDSEPVIKMESDGPNPLGMPPITKLYFSESAKAGQQCVPLSLLTRPAMVARVMLNLKSQADSDLLAAVTRWFMSGIGSDELPDTYGPGTVWKVSNPEASLQVVQGDVAHIGEKREWLLLYLGEILRLLKFRGGMAELQANSGSGLKLAIERTDLENELRATAGQLEAAELEMMRQAVSLRTGKVISKANAAKELGYSTTYNRDFVFEPVGAMLGNIKTWLSDCSLAVDDVPEIGREMMRQLANALVREGTPSHEQMITEIDAAVMDGAGPEKTGETPPTVLVGGQVDKRDTGDE
jgi:hypothetical protein